MSDIVKFRPKRLSNDEYMRRYRAECAIAGEQASPDKGKSGDPGMVTTSDGDVLHMGACRNCGDPADQEFCGMCREMGCA